MAKKINGISQEWNDFILCILLHFIFPFFPIYLEYLFNDSISHSNLIMFICIYSLSLGLSSRNAIIGIVCMLISITFSSFYGFILKENNNELISWYVILLIFVVIVFPHLIERYNRHYIEQEVFLKWQLSRNRS